MRIESDILKTAAVVGLLSAAFVFVAWMPLNSKRAELEQSITTLQQQQNAKAKAPQELRKLRQAVSDLTAVVASSDKIVPKNNDLGPLIRELSTKLKQLGMVDPEIQTQKILRGADYNVIPLSLKFQGDYTGFFEFIKATEGQDRLIRIHELLIKGRPTRDEPLSVSIQLTTFSEGGGGVQP